jgi:aspartokinase/homoserine dehydrogenase 1
VKQKVIKFGGTSVGSSSAIMLVKDIITKKLNQHEGLIVVCSAMSGVTNLLVNAGIKASEGNIDYKKNIYEIESKHISTIKTLIPNHGRNESIELVLSLLKNLENVLDSVFNLRELSQKSEDSILSFGEILSCNIIAQYLNINKIPAKFVDARNFIKTNHKIGNTNVDFELTNKLITNYFKKLDYIPIVTGFISSNENNETTNLGRGGSDFTASIIGAAINASEVEIWTDVDGVMTCDPKHVKKAFTVPNLSYQEAMELSLFGAKIIYSPTIYPVFKKNIPLWVKNTFNNEFKATLISGKKVKTNYLIKGISSINSIVMLTVTGNTTLLLSELLSRTFKVMTLNNINVILTSQASSEYSISIVVASDDAAIAAEEINYEFRSEIKNKQVEPVQLRADLSVLSIIGENMRDKSGVAGKFFNTLGKNGINIVAIAQGSSELNISIVLQSKELNKSLNVVHSAFFDNDDVDNLNLFMIGTGLIGKTLLKQIKQHANYLLKEKKLKINVVGLANTRNMRIAENGINVGNYEDYFTHEDEKMNLSKFINKMLELNLPNTVFIDCTNSKEIVAHYASILKANISIATPNKLANSGSYIQYSELKNLTFQHGGTFCYETNVGAGLPVIKTLRNLILSGDKIIKIEGVFSGTLSYIFNNFTGKKKFSEIVKKAKELGYTEPDPRDDLAGTDVARKILILAREAGSKLELTDIVKSSIIPQDCIDAVNVNNFFDILGQHDDYFEEMKIKAKKENKVLRFIAKYENNSITIGLTTVNNAHPFYNLSGSDNIISFTTNRYKNRPLVIQGPGAGAEVTASGVFGEIINIINYLKN